MNTKAVWALALVSALVLAGCTGSEPQEATPSASPTRPADPIPSREPLTAGERAQQLTALSPEQFDLTYRLTGKGPRPDAKVRMRAKGERFRLDVTRGRSTAVLVNGPRGVVSCQILQPKKGRADKSCFLVAKSPKGLPNLFDPEVQRLFRSATRTISAGRKQLAVKDAGVWRAPRGLGPAECFAVKGKGLDDGTYCYLSKPAPTIGLLARAVFPSGKLELREVKNVRLQGLFRPPVQPTPLPARG
ncbi:MAG: hypothetical protein LH645_10145 [Actinomycetia bacterium]|nr:hypothetical protein [Actinomycetes bacterium]